MKLVPAHEQVDRAPAPVRPPSQAAVVFGRGHAELVGELEGHVARQHQHARAEADLLEPEQAFRFSARLKDARSIVAEFYQRSAQHL